VKYQYSGVLQPINTDGSSIFNAGRTIPIKFRLYCSGTTVVETATATLSVFKITDAVLGTVEEVDPEASGESNTGNLFRFDPDDQQYIYNWSTKGLSGGTYRIHINLDDGTVHEVALSLRAK